MNSPLTAAGLFCDIAGGVLIALGLMLKGRRKIVAEASMHWGRNPHLLISLAKQTADAQVGAAMLTVGFVLQLDGSLGWRPSWAKEYAVLPAAGALVVMALAFLLVVLRPWQVRRVVVDDLQRQWSDALQYKSEDAETALYQAVDRWGIVFGRERERTESSNEFGLHLIGARAWEALVSSTVGTQTGSTVELRGSS